LLTTAANEAICCHFTVLAV